MLDNYFYFEKISVLELFAGTGSISFEFASRGTLHITTIDNNPKCISWIAHESERLGFDFIEALKMDSAAYLKHFASGPYDIVFADPPYDYKYYADIHKYVFEKNMLSEKGWLIFEHDRNNNFRDFPFYSDSRSYGQSIISVFKLNQKENDNN